MTKKHKTLLLQFDRILSQDILRQVLILVIILSAVFVFSFILLSISGNDWQQYCEEKSISKWVFPLYLLIDGNAYNNFYGDKHVGGWAVFMVSLIYVAGVVIFTGMLISVMTNMIERRVENHRGGLIHYLKSGHYIIMGYDDLVPSFISYIFGKAPDAYVLILTSVSAEKVNEKLNKTFSKKQLEKVIVNYGHRTNPESYKDIYLESAEEVFIIGYHHGQNAHDAINVECVDSICQYLTQSHITQRPTRITCAFKDLDTYSAFKTTEIFSKVGQLGIEFVPYNFYTNWAKQVFVKRSHKLSYTSKDNDTENNNEIVYPAVFGNGIKPDDPKFVHLVFVGTTNFAVAFAMEAAQVLHFPNFKPDNRLRTRITFIDLNADKEKDEFITRNRHFFEIQSYRYQDLSEGSSCEKCVIVPSLLFEGEDADFLDVEFEFIKGDIFSKQVQEEIGRWAKDKDEQYLSIFLAMQNQRNNFVMGMNMPDEVYDNNVPVFIRQDRSDNFVTNLRKADDREQVYTCIENGELKEDEHHKLRYANIYPFGMIESAYSADDKSLQRAKLINYLYCTANYETYKFQGKLSLDAIPKEKIWEDAEKMWRELNVSLKWSNLYNSYAIRTKQATLRVMRGLELENKEKDTQPLSEDEAKILACIEHNRWNVEKLLMGYRKPHGNEDKYKVTSAEEKKKLARNKKIYIHHDIRPFDKLGDIVELDMEFSRYIPWIIEMTETND